MIALDKFLLHLVGIYYVCVYIYMYTDACIHIHKDNVIEVFIRKRNFQSKLTTTKPYENQWV